MPSLQPWPFAPVSGPQPLACCFPPHIHYFKSYLESDLSMATQKKKATTKKKKLHLPWYITCKHRGRAEHKAKPRHSTSPNKHFLSGSFIITQSGLYGIGLVCPGHMTMAGLARPSRLALIIGLWWVYVQVNRFVPPWTAFTRHGLSVTLRPVAKFFCVFLPVYKSAMLHQGFG